LRQLNAFYYVDCIKNFGGISFDNRKHTCGVEKLKCLSRGWQKFVSEDVIVDTIKRMMENQV